jgi:hypothetical protein
MEIAVAAENVAVRGGEPEGCGSLRMEGMDWENDEIRMTNDESNSKNSMTNVRKGECSVILNIRALEFDSSFVVRHSNLATYA